MAKKTARNRRQRRIARTRKMIGGAYSPTELQELQSAQFSENQVQSLQQMNIPFNDVMIKINQLRNQVPDDELSEHVMVEILNEQIFQNPNAEDSMRANTTSASESIGNSQMSNGGKRRRSKTSRKNKGRKTRKSRNQRGGTCYGNGVGANSYDPNDSIYNTNMLKLFPYRAQ